MQIWYHRTMHLRFVIVIILLLFCALPSFVFATTVHPAPLSDLVTQADEIFVGTCQSVDATTLKTPLGIPIKKVTFTVTEVVAGGVTVGTVSWHQTRPDYVPSETYLLFLRNLRSRHSLKGVVGLMQGKFRVRADGSVHNALNNQFLLPGTAGGESGAPGSAKGASAPGTTAPLTVDSMKDLVEKFRGTP
jgi:hypothetical protein